jgi:hypothetical protein
MTTVCRWDNPTYRYNEMGELLAEDAAAIAPSDHDGKLAHVCALCGEQKEELVRRQTPICEECAELCHSALI